MLADIGTDWSWWILFLLPVAWLLQNVAHEGSHLLAVRWLCLGVAGGRMGMIPWPHRYGGRFYFSRCWYEYAGQCNGIQFVHLAPVIMCCCELFVYVLFFVFLGLWMLPFIVCAVADLLFWNWGYLFGSADCDGKRYRALLNSGD